MSPKHPLISASELSRLLGEVKLFDLRWSLAAPAPGRETYEEGHIPGAVFVDLDHDLAAEKGDGRHPLPAADDFIATLGRLGLSPDDTVVVYDDQGGAVAARMWWMLESIGHPGEVSVLDGGLQEWIGHGFPIDTGSVTPEPAAYPAVAGYTGVVRHDELQGRYVADLRSAERYRGETEPVDPKAGHIPGAVNVPLAGQSRRRTLPGKPRTGRALSGFPRRRHRLVRQRSERMSRRTGPGHRRASHAGRLHRVVLRLVETRSAGRHRAQSVITARAVEAIESSDTDELLRIVDGLCSSRNWDDLIELRGRCAEAVARGKQVWGVEEHIRYRLVLEAPAPIAGPVVAEGQSRFALGPLPEVAASTKTWAELAPHLPPGPERDTVAAERVVRGELVDVPIPDLPATLLAWEPAYPLATYKKDKVETPAPPIPDTTAVTLPDQAQIIGDTDSLAALGDLVEPWTDQSNGRSQTAAVEGDHLAAIAALGMKRARVAGIDPGHGSGMDGLGCRLRRWTWAPSRRRCRSLSGVVGGGDAHRPGMAGRP